MDIIKYIDENGILKSTNMLKKDKTLQQELWPYDFEFDKISEILYCSYHKISPPTCSYGNKRKFLDFSAGYNLGCNLSKIKKCNCYLDRRRELNKIILHNPENKEKISLKRKKTNIEKYGFDNPFKNKEIQKKYKDTMYHTYGVDNPQKIKSIKEKTEQTNLKKYGHKNVLASDAIKKRIIENNIELYGCKNSKQRHINSVFFDIIQNKNIFIEYVSNKSFQNLLKEFNISPSLLSKWIDLYCAKEYIHYSFNKSLEEKEVFDFISTITKNVISGDRSVLKPKEIDIFLPDFNIGIEYCGLYWHSVSKGRDSNYHKNKLLECNKKNIDLIQIFSDEWHDKQDIVKSIISTKLGLNDKIYARKTIIKEITEKESKIFLNENHLQGNVIGSTKRYGLFFNELLVSVMTFQLKNDIWELKRYANKLHMNIVGGGSKLFSYFIKENNPNEVFSYCDLRYFNGGIYKSLGFIFDSITKPGYFYTDGINKYHRLNFTKKKLIDKGYDSTKTEKEIMSDLGYDVIYDCGHSKWIWKK